MIFRDGFYINDPPGANQIVLTAGIAASGVLDVYVASGGITGGLYATINFHLHNDSDSPRLRLLDIYNQLLTNPLGIFDVSGDLTARLFAFVEVSFIVTYRKEFDLASVTLISFNTNPEAGQARDVMSLATSASPSVYGQAVTVTATVKPTSTSGTSPVPAGSVQFYVNGAKSGNPVTLSANGTATISIAGLSPGNNDLQANYSATNNYRSSQDTLTTIVTAATTTTAVSTGPPNPVYGQPFSFTAIVAGAAPGVDTPGRQSAVLQRRDGHRIACRGDDDEWHDDSHPDALGTACGGLPHDHRHLHARRRARFSGSSTTQPSSFVIAAAASQTADHRRVAYKPFGLWQSGDLPGHCGRRVWGRPDRRGSVH